MACTACGASNPEGSRFCNECGVPVGGPPSCPTCGQVNPRGAKFCNLCGTRLLPATGMLAPPPGFDPLNPTTGALATPTPPPAPPSALVSPLPSTIQPGYVAAPPIPTIETPAAGLLDPLPMSSPPMAAPPAKPLAPPTTVERAAPAPDAPTSASGVAPTPPIVATPAVESARSLPPADSMPFAPGTTILQWLNEPDEPESQPAVSAGAGSSANGSLETGSARAAPLDEAGAPGVWMVSMPVATAETFAAPVVSDFSAYNNDSTTVNLTEFDEAAIDWLEAGEDESAAEPAKVSDPRDRAAATDPPWMLVDAETTEPAPAASLLDTGLGFPPAIRGVGPGMFAAPPAAADHTTENLGLYDNAANQEWESDDSVGFPSLRSATAPRAPTSDVDGALGAFTRSGGSALKPSADLQGGEIGASFDNGWDWETAFEPGSVSEHGGVGLSDSIRSGQFQPAVEVAVSLDQTLLEAEWWDEPVVPVFSQSPLAAGVG